MGDLGEGAVVDPGFLEAEGFANLAGNVSMVFGGVEVAEMKVDTGELPQRECFIGFVVEGLLAPQAFFDGAAGSLKVLPGGGLVAALAGSLAFLLANDADVLRSVAEATLILQLYGQLAGFLVPGPRLGQAASLGFGHAKEIVGLHHAFRVARFLKELERLLVEAGGAVELLAIIGEAALVLEERSLQRVRISKATRWAKALGVQAERAKKL